MTPLLGEHTGRLRRSPVWTAGSVAMIAAIAAACSSSGGTNNGAAPPAGGSAAGTGAVRATGSPCKTANSAGASFGYTANTDPSDEKNEAADFHKTYPNIKINYTQAETGNAVTQVLAEVQAGRSLDFNMMSGTYAELSPLITGGDFVKLDPATLKLDPSVVLRGKTATFVRVHRKFGGLAYNTKHTKPSDLPDTWEGLVNPKFRGKIMVNPVGTPLSPLVIPMGYDKFNSFVTKLVSTDDPVFVAQATPQLQKIASGEMITGDGGDNSDVDELKASGVPIAMKYLDQVPAFDVYGAILKSSDTNATNAAECYLSWLVSKAGDAAQLKYEGKTNSTLPPGGLPPGSHLVQATTLDQANEVASAAAVIANLASG